MVGVLAETYLVAPRGIRLEDPVGAYQLRHRVTPRLRRLLTYNLRHLRVSVSLPRRLSFRKLDMAKLSGGRKIYRDWNPLNLLVHFNPLEGDIIYALQSPLAIYRPIPLLELLWPATLKCFENS
jgi:hypothetical protein